MNNHLEDLALSTPKMRFFQIGFVVLFELIEALKIFTVKSARATFNFRLCLDQEFNEKKENRNINGNRKGR